MTRRIKVVAFKRKREGRTNYRKRLKLLASDKPRLVVRKHLRSVDIQLVEFSLDGDRVILTVSSNQLVKLGWKFNRGNLPASYLAGLMFGKKAVNLGIKEAVLDIGLNDSVKGSIFYAVLKGVVDAGVKVPHAEDVMPSEDRIKGLHIKKYLNKAEDLPEQFDVIKKKIIEGQNG